MSTSLDPRLLKAVSTNADLSYLRQVFSPTVSNRLRDLMDLSDLPEHRFNKDWIDPLNPVIRRLRKLDKSTMQPIVYNGQKITTLSFQVYGTTSLWYVPLYVSGYCHPHEVPHGSVLYFPALQKITDLFKIDNKSKRGSIVRT